MIPPVRRVLCVLAAALVWTGAADARTPPVQVLDAGGGVVAQALSFPFALPEDGSFVSVASGHADVRGVELHGVTLLGGRVHADRIFVPAHGAVGGRVDGLIVDGLAATADTNSL